MYLCGFDFYALRGTHACCLDDGIVYVCVSGVFGFVLQEVDVDGAAEQGLEDDEGACLGRYNVAFFAGGTVDACNKRSPWAQMKRPREGVTYMQYTRLRTRMLLRGRGRRVIYHSLREISFLYHCYEIGRTVIEGFDGHTPSLASRFVENKSGRRRLARATDL